MNVFDLATDDRYLWLNMTVHDDFDLLHSMEGKSICDIWRTPRVHPIKEKGFPDRPIGDFSTIGGVTPVFSERAAIALHEILEPHGELLPLIAKEGTYFAFNVTTVIDALDEEHSTLVRFPSSHKVMHVYQYSFHPERLCGATIFKIPQNLRSRVFVTEAFVDAVSRTNLVGFRFPRLWSDEETVAD